MRENIEAIVYPL